MANDMNRDCCGICLKDFIKPKRINCNHVFCESCLSDVVKIFQENQFPCPLCQVMNIVPEGDVQYFPAYVRKEVNVCVVCKNNVDAEVMCVECNKAMCTSCRVIHDVFQTHHHIYQIDANRENVNMCQEHVDDTLEFYCKSCSVPVCKRCLETKHTQHSTLNLQEYHETVKEELVGIKAEFYEYIGYVAPKIEAVQKSIDETYNTIDREIEDFSLKANNMRDEMTDDFKTRCALQEKQIYENDRLITKLQTGTECISRVLNDLQEALKFLPEMKTLCAEMKIYRRTFIPDRIDKIFNEELGKMAMSMGRSFTHSFSVTDLNIGPSLCSPRFIVGCVYWQIQLRKGELIHSDRFSEKLPSFDVSLSAFVEEDMDIISITSCEVKATFMLQNGINENSILKTFIKTVTPPEKYSTANTNTSPAQFIWKVVDYNEQPLDILNIKVKLSISNKITQ